MQLCITNHQYIAMMLMSFLLVFGYSIGINKTEFIELERRDHLYTGQFGTIGHQLFDNFSKGDILRLEWNTFNLTNANPFIYFRSGIHDYNTGNTTLMQEYWSNFNGSYEFEIIRDAIYVIEILFSTIAYQTMEVLLGSYNYNYILLLK